MVHLDWEKFKRLSQLISSNLCHQVSVLEILESESVSRASNKTNNITHLFKEHYTF